MREELSHAFVVQRAHVRRRRSARAKQCEVEELSHAFVVQPSTFSTSRGKLFSVSVVAEAKSRIRPNSSQGPGEFSPLHPRLAAHRGCSIWGTS